MRVVYLMWHCGIVALVWALPPLQTIMAVGWLINLFIEWKNVDCHSKF